MLAATKLPEVLRTLLSDGIEAACLMTSEGSLLCSVHTPNSGSKVSETSLAAISSSIMNNFIQGNQEVSFHILKLEHGCLAITTAGKGYLIAAYGSNVALGLLRGRLLAMSQHFARVFEQLK